ncbi:MAG: hypothetical protein IME93_00150 [Proteobacteria bacterium]|nr:hypothetical protein [Pseudomonadota bacterium]
MPERRSNRTPITDMALTRQLQYVANESGLVDLVIATDNGLMLAEAATRGRGEMLAAMAGSIYELNKKFPDMGGPEDIHSYRMLRNDNSCISAYFFEHDGQQLILMLTSPPDMKAKEYGQRMVTGVQRILSETNEDILSDDAAREKFRE